MTNTKERHEEIYNASVRVLKIFGGVKAIDALSQKQRIPQLRKMAKMVKEITDCHIVSAKRNSAKAMRRARYGITQDRWGGARPDTGPVPLPKDQKRQPVSTLLAPGSKELAQAIAEILELPGWGYAVDQALVKLVEGDRELKIKLAQIGIIIKSGPNRAVDHD